MAGYSPTPLVRKLGYKAGFHVHLYQAPRNYGTLIASWPPDLMFYQKPGLAQIDLAHAFFVEEANLGKQLPHLKASLKKTGMLWLSWPKGKSGIPTDLNREIIRQYGLDAGLVDVKVAAVDEQWSGLKFVYRSKDR